MNILAQVLGITAITIMFLSYQKKSKKDFLFLQIFMNVFFALQYTILNAFSAVAQNIISIIKSIIFYGYEKENKKIPGAYLIIFEIIVVISLVLTYNGLYSIIPAVIALVYTYGTWQKNLKTTYKIGVVASILWIYYNLKVGAYVSITSSVIEFIASVRGLINLRDGKKEKNTKYVKVMFGTDSLAGDSGFSYKIGEVNVADNWNPNSEDPKETGGFNYSVESKILRWLVRGDTIYDVIIPEDAEVIEVNSESAPGGVFRSNKIIIENPRKVTDKMALDLYKKSDLPEKSYYKAMAGCAVRGYLKTVERIIKDKVNKDNIDLVLSEVNDFLKPDDSHPDGSSSCSKYMIKLLNDIKNSNK